MPKQKHRDGTADLKRLAKYFADEVASRAWGKAEFAKLIRQSAKAREKSDDPDREMTRLILAALDRVTSIQVAADAIGQILEDAERPIASRVVRDVLAVLRDQAHRAVSDAFGAVRAVERPRLRCNRRISRLPISKAAAALAAFQPEPADLVSLLAGRLTPVQRSLRESMMACWFVERAVETVEGLIRKQRVVDPAALRDLATFLMNSAAFARDVITVRVAAAIERGPLRNWQTTT